MTAADLDCLNNEQRQAVEHTGSPLLILAGAGSGKTRVITTKIAYLIGKGVDAHSILAVTFTKKAASEMKERAIALESRAAKSKLCTFHSFGAWFLRAYGGAIEGNADIRLHTLSDDFTVYDDDDAVALMCDALPQFKKDKKSARVAYRSISLAKDYCLGPEDDLTNVAGNQDVEELRAIYRKYQEALARTGNADFGDLIMLPALLLERNEHLARRMQSLFSTVMVDEYQDADVAQFRLLQALAGDVRQTGVYVCVVGDDDQSIYKFRGAEVSNILHFADVFPGTQTIALTRNYRSTREILQAANNVVHRNTGRLEKTLTAERGAGEKPSLVYLDNSDAEASFCADMIMSWMTGNAGNAGDGAPMADMARQGLPTDETAGDGSVVAPIACVQTASSGMPSPRYSDWAVLYRSNAQSRAFETEFMQRKIPYVMVGTVEFYKREEVKDVLAVLSLASNERDEVAFRRVVNKPARGVGGKSVDAVVSSLDSGKTLLEAAEGAASSGAVNKKAAAGLREFCDVIRSVKESIRGHGEDGGALGNLSEAVKTAAVRSGLLEYHRNEGSEKNEKHAGDNDEVGSERYANIQELIASAIPYDLSTEGFRAFLDDVALSQAENKASDAVTLITVHNTKGLEFSRVLLTGVETGIFPHGNEDPEGLEEERRLFYVGVTRARDSLCITTCSERYLYGHMAQMTPSRFIAEAGDVFNVVDKRWLVNRAARYGLGYRQIGAYANKRGGGAGQSPYQLGARVYSDDYGYGNVISSIERNGECVVTVQFESGAQKRFMPEYQPGALQAVDEE